MTAKSYCIFSAHYLPHVGGIEQYTDNLARELARRGCQATVVTNALFDDAGRDEPCPGVEVFRLPCCALVDGRLPIPRKNDLFAELWSEVRRRRFDGIMINARFYPHTFLGLDLAMAQGVRPIVVDHGSAYLTLGNPLIDPAIALYEKVVTHFVKKRHPDFYAVSTKGMHWLENFGIEGKGVLSNSIDAEAYRNSASSRNYREELGIDEHTLLVAFTGRLTPEKGVAQLMEAARILAERKVPVTVLMAGDGPLRKSLDEQNPGNVALLGRTDPADVAALMLQADLLCMITRSEGFSTSLLEASACGTPALITDVGGVDELIPDETFGTVLKDDSALNAAAEIEALEKDRGRLRAQGNRVRSRVEQLFSWRNTADALIEACRYAQSHEAV